MKALKVTISGSYKTSGGDIVDYEDVSGVIPFVDDEHAKMHVKSRYASDWVSALRDDADKKVYPDRIEHMRQVFVDDFEIVEHEFSYVGKDVKEMSFEELQDLATAKDLRSIPLPKRQSGFSLREARMRAYVAYANKVEGMDLDYNDPEFEYGELPPLIVDGGIRKETAKKMSNDEIIEAEQKAQSSSPKSHLTIDDLKEIADKKGIEYHHKTGYDKLYAMIYGSAA